MRTIRYRHWNGNTKEMHYKDRWDTFPVSGENECFLQFTGLLDKSGKEIYEGDILRRWREDLQLWEGQPYVIDTWECAGFFATTQTPDEAGGNPSRKYKVSGSVLAQMSGDGCEIIGNMYENPELLCGEAANKKK